MPSCHTSEAHERMGSKFRYPRLKTASSIRLLEIHVPARRKAPNYRFVDLPLAEARNKYTAVSYTWGNATLVACISLNGRKFPIRRNIFDFLSQLNEARWRGLLWIDAICINQNNIHEKNLQVSRMGTIFDYAREVKAWLGPGTAASDQLFDFFSSINSEVFDWSSSRKFVYPEDIDRYDAAREYLDGLDDVVRRPYWSRLWIVQECALANVVLLHCGSKSIIVKLVGRYNTAFAEMLRRFKNQNPTLAPGSIASQLAYDDIGLGLTRRFGLTITSTSWMSCQEKHDRVYALMGKARDQLPTVEWTCDYSMSLPDLLQRVAMQCGPNESIEAVLTLLYWWKLPVAAPEYHRLNIKVTLKLEKVHKVFDTFTGTLSFHPTNSNRSIRDLVVQTFEGDCIIIFRKPRFDRGSAEIWVPPYTRPVSSEIWLSNLRHRFYTIDLDDHVLLYANNGAKGGICLCEQQSDIIDRKVSFASLLFGYRFYQLHTTGHSLLWPLKDVFARWFETATLTRDDDENLEIELPIESWIRLARDLESSISRVQRENMNFGEDTLVFTVPEFNSHDKSMSNFVLDDESVNQDVSSSDEE